MASNADNAYALKLVDLGYLKIIKSLLHLMKDPACAKELNWTLGNLIVAI